MVLRAPGSGPATRTPAQGRGREAGVPSLRQAGPPEVAIWLLRQAGRAKETVAGWFKPHPQSRKRELLEAPAAKVFWTGVGLHPHGGKGGTRGKDGLQMLEGDCLHIKVALRPESAAESDAN